MANAKELKLTADQQATVSNEFIKLYGGTGGQVVIGDTVYSIGTQNQDGTWNVSPVQSVSNSSSGGSGSSSGSPSGSGTTPSTNATPAGTYPVIASGAAGTTLNPTSMLFQNPTLVTPAASAASGANPLQTIMSAGEQAAGPLIQLKASKAASGAGQFHGMMNNLVNTPAGGAPGLSQINSYQSASAASDYYTSQINTSQQQLYNTQTSLQQHTDFLQQFPDSQSFVDASVTHFQNQASDALTNLNLAQNKLAIAQSNLISANSALASPPKGADLAVLNSKALGAQGEVNVASKNLETASTTWDNFNPDNASVNLDAQTSQIKKNAADFWTNQRSQGDLLGGQITQLRDTIATTQANLAHTNSLQALYKGYSENAFGAVDLSSSNPEVKVAWDYLNKNNIKPTNATLSTTILQMRQQALTLSPESLETAKAELIQEQQAIAARDGVDVVNPTDVQIHTRALLDQKNQYVLSTQQQSLKMDLSKVRADEIKIGATLATTALTAYGLEDQIGNMFRNGGSFKGIAAASALFVGMAVSLHVMNGAITDLIGNGRGLQGMLANSDLQHGFLNSMLSTSIGHGFLKGLQFLTSLPGTLLLTGFLVFVGWLSSRNSGSDEDAVETLNAETAPVVWNTGPVMMITAGLALSSMGINLSPAAPMMQTMTVPTVQLNKALTTATGGSLPSASERYGTVFVQQGANGAPTEVLYLTPSADGQDTVHVATLNPNVQFTAPNGNAPYVPFFKIQNGKSTPNPQVVQGLAAQQQLLHSVPADGTAGGQSAAVQAAASDKSGVTPVSSGQ